ncbi:MAG: hypothetical protein ABIY70_19060 [Capsulimonas sp.]|uniref:hypothetical protein n=1 Tax=Capsulimonas sp. TaxID=2494211 RepID=UPI00326720AA
MPSHRPHTLMYSVHNSRQVKFQGYAPDWTYWGLGHPEAVTMLRQSGGFHHQAHGQAHGAKVRIVIQDDRIDYPRYYDYIPETGEIGWGSEWCTIPSSLNKAVRQSMSPK